MTQEPRSFPVGIQAGSLYRSLAVLSQLGAAAGGDPQIAICTIHHTESCPWAPGSDRIRAQVEHSQALDVTSVQIAETQLKYTVRVHPRDEDRKTLRLTELSSLQLDLTAGRDGGRLRDRSAAIFGRSRRTFFSPRRSAADGRCHHLMDCALSHCRARHRCATVSHCRVAVSLNHRFGSCRIARKMHGSDARS